MTTDTEVVLEQPDANAAPTADELAAEQEFAAGFKRVVKGDETPVVEKVTEDVETTTAQAVVETPEAPKAEEKEVAAAPAAVTPDLSAIVRAEIEKSEHRIRSDMGRQLAAFKAAAGKAAAQEATDAPNDAQIQAAAKGGGVKWKALQEEWPEWAAALEERLALPGNTPQAVDVGELAAQVRERLPQVNTEEIIQATVTEIKHPGWKAMVNTPAFKTWYSGQPADVQALGASAAAGDAIKLLDTFSDFTARAQQQQRSQTRLDNAVTPKGAATSGPKPLDAEAEFALGFNSVMKRR